MAFLLATLSFHYDKVLEINLLMLIWEEDSVNGGKYDLDSRNLEQKDHSGTFWLTHYSGIYLWCQNPGLSESYERV